MSRRNGAVVQWCGLVVAAYVSDWRVPIWCLALRSALRAGLVRGRVSTFADNVSLWCVSFTSRLSTWRAVFWVFPVTVLCGVKFMSIVSLFVPEALYLHSFFVAVLSVLLIVPVCFVWSSTFVSLGAIFMTIVSLFVSRLLYLYPFMVTDLPVPSVIPVGFVWGFASLGFFGGVFCVVVFDSSDILSREVLPRASGLTWYAFM